VSRSSEPLTGFRLELLVRFSECDLYGVVWHGHYAIYLEETRSAIFEKYGWTVKRAKEKGFLVPVTRMEIQFRSPARLDSRVTVTARLRKPDVARIVVDYEIRDPGGKLLITALTEQVLTREDGELLLAMPEFVKDLTQAILRGQDDPKEQKL
jgi:acyl-CoA thioester hydrolase